MSLYSLKSLILKFESSDIKSKFDISISVINREGKEEKIFENFFDEHIWSQLCLKLQK
jgi:hypothetical protein